MTLSVSRLKVFVARKGLFSHPCRLHVNGKKSENGRVDTTLFKETIHEHKNRYIEARGHFCFASKSICQ